MKQIAANKRAYYDYEILETYEAGLVLTGSEIKSIREGKVSLKGSFISVRNGESWWKGGMVLPWSNAAKGTNHEENRERKLLLHKKEIKKIQKSLDLMGYTVVPLKLGLVRGRAKIVIGLAKGKKNYDKRHSIKKRDIERRELR